ncbi:hypothetical protein [Flexivirga alba]|uniref:DUF4352 domain-containing protein n=1 Tax=Flexivirga alba TaxID=702742 RepID=A0ABW2AMJ8_9MICO
MSLSAASLLIVAVAGCSSDSPSGPKSSGSSTSGSAPSSGGSGTSSTKGPSAADAAIAKVMGSSNDLPVLASSSGTLNTSTGSSAVVAEVLQVMTSDQATRVTWRLKSASSATANTKSFQFARPPLFDTRLLGLVNSQTKTTLHPYTSVPAGGNGMDNGCACSSLPDSVNSQGTILYAVLPALPTGATTVNVTLPGFKTMTGVKVTS